MNLDPIFGSSSSRSLLLRVYVPVTWFANTAERLIGVTVGFRRFPSLMPASGCACSSRPGPADDGRRLQPGWWSSLAPEVSRSNMRPSRGQLSFLRVCVLSCVTLLLCSTCAGSNMAAARHTLTRGRRSHRSARAHGGAHHRPLTDAQRADQNLQFMLSLYRSAAEPDGRPRQHRRFGSNTVRLLRPAAASVHYRPLSRGERTTPTSTGPLSSRPINSQISESIFIYILFHNKSY